MYAVLTAVFMPLTFISLSGALKSFNYKAFSGFAKRNLVAIQMLQRECKETKRKYCGSTEELVSIWDEKHAGEYNAVIDEIRNKETGGIYSYSIVKADEDNFLAEASLVGDKTNEQGADVWQITSEGKPEHVKEAAFNRSPPKTIIITLLLSILFLALTIREYKAGEREKVIE